MSAAGEAMAGLFEITFIKNPDDDVDAGQFAQLHKNLIEDLESFVKSILPDELCYLEIKLLHKCIAVNKISVELICPGYDYISDGFWTLNSEVIADMAISTLKSYRERNAISTDSLLKKYKNVKPVMKKFGSHVDQCTERLFLRMKCNIGKLRVEISCGNKNFSVSLEDRAFFSKITRNDHKIDFDSFRSQATEIMMMIEVSKMHTDKGWQGSVGSERYPLILHPELFARFLNKEVPITTGTEIIATCTPFVTTRPGINKFISYIVYDARVIRHWIDPRGGDQTLQKKLISQCV